jgi:hypothetical protein
MDTEKQNSRLQWAVFVLLLATQIVLLTKLLITDSDYAAVITAIIVVAALLLINIRVFDLGSLRVGTKGLEAELKSVKNQVAEVDKRVSQLFLLTMAPAMYENLRKLVSGNFGRYEMSGGLRRELYHLRDIGYIAVGSISQSTCSC